ncbi:MAG TPA: alanine racemase [Candidatus Tectomicrobia bacterium]|nr:alanine racemase [Candidatus Tectomicrobia bacterium]
MITPNTWVEIDRTALLANVHSCRRLLGPHCRLLGLVKGNAYGHGLCETSTVLLEGGVDMLGVEAVGEGVTLRTSGITCPLLLVGPIPPANVPLLRSHRLTPVLVSPEQVQMLGEYARQAACELDVHLKFDTGMHRQGIMWEELPVLLDLLAKYPGLRVSGVATHLARADEAEQPEWTQRQLDRFHHMIATLAAAGIHTPIRHAANSAATLLWPETHLDMVRLGIALYGFWPGEAVVRARTTQLTLCPVMTWKTRVAAVKAVPCGCGVGYGGSFVTGRASRIAVLPLGYYDGYGRGLSNLGQVLIHGQRVPVCGRVSMNLMTVDVTDIPAVQPGDEAVLLGQQGTAAISAEEMAAWLGTIHYEVTARINPLIPRVIVGSSGQVGGLSRP